MIFWPFFFDPSAMFCTERTKTPDQDNQRAHDAAGAFHDAGAATQALLAWIAATGTGELPLVSAVTQALAPLAHSHGYPPAHKLRVLTIMRFITSSKANERFDETQRLAVMRFATWPVEEESRDLGDVLAWMAARHFPESEEIRRMWCLGFTPAPSTVPPQYTQRFYGLPQRRRRKWVPDEPQSVPSR